MQLLYLFAILAITLAGPLSEARARTSSKVNTINYIEVESVKTGIPAKLLRELELEVNPEVAKHITTEEEKNHEKKNKDRGNEGNGQRSLRLLWKIEK